MSSFPIDTVFAALAAQLGERATRANAVIAAHGASESYHAAHPPDIVVFPQSTEEVAGIVAICAAHGAPIVPWGAGTSLEGNASAVHGGVCIDFAQMSRLLKKLRLSKSLRPPHRPQMLNPHPQRRLPWSPPRRRPLCRLGRPKGLKRPAFPRK